MANFKTQVEDLTGSLNDDAAITQWLTDGARLMLNVLPLSILSRVASTTNYTTPVNVEGKKIISVLRKDSTLFLSYDKYMPCRELSPSFIGKVQDEDYMEYASASDPAYIIENNLLTIYPASADGKIVNINTSITVDYNSSSITNFPDEAEFAVVLYAARNGLERLISNLNVDEDPELAASYINQYTLIDRRYKEALQLLGIEKIYVEKKLSNN